MFEILTAYGMASFTAREGSDSPNGLHKLYILKLCLPVLFVLGILAAIDRIGLLLRRLGKVSIIGFVLATLPAIGLVLFRGVKILQGL